MMASQIRMTPDTMRTRAAQYGAEADRLGEIIRSMDGLLAYMYTMIEECRKRDIRLDRKFLIECGRSIQLFPGVREWFGRINAFGESLGVEIEHYVLSSRSSACCGTRNTEAASMAL